MVQKNQIELLAPAGDLEKMKFALIYGADAVYIGGQIFGLRAAARNFTVEEMREGIEFAHNLSKKVYLVLNIIPHNEDLIELETYIETIKTLEFDAIILSDPGTLMYVKEHLPNMEIHLSTQANNTNYMSAKFWQSQGVARVILAREMSMEDIKTTVQNVPDMDFEAFVHGAMCISYSGRCLLSNYMVGKDANRGDCKHACRWEYVLMEKKRPDKYYPVIEDDTGTYFFNAKDLCMIEHIPELIDSGLSSLKIEGRMKSLYYVASVVGAYRRAIDMYIKDPDNYEYDPEWLVEIKKVSHRDFSTGFYFGKPDNTAQHYGTSAYIRDYDFVGIVNLYDEQSGMAVIEQRNKLVVGDEIEIIQPYGDMLVQKIEYMLDDRGKEIDSAPHAQQIISIRIDKPVCQYAILRKERIKRKGDIGFNAE